MPEKIFHKTFNAPLNHQLTESFYIEKTGVYLVVIEASAKSWWQNFPQLLRRFFADDELTTTLFVDPAEKIGQGIKWNGNDLHGLVKIGAILTKLTPGNLEIVFEPKQTPLIRSIGVYEVTGGKLDLLSCISPNNEGGNRRPWLEITFNDVILQEIKTTARTEEGRAHLNFLRDDDDLQIAVNGKIIHNDLAGSHDNWYWCGRVQKGLGRELTINPDEGIGIKNICFRSDRTPVIETLDLILIKKPLSDVREIKNLITKEALRYGFRQDVLLRLVEIESNFNPLVVSPDGQDKGIFRLRTVTIEEIKRISNREINPLDAEENIEGALIYFNKLYQEYKNTSDSLKKTLVAWNWGPSNFNGQEPLDWEVIPETTRNLVNFVLETQ